MKVIAAAPPEHDHPEARRVQHIATEARERLGPATCYVAVLALTRDGHALTLDVGGDGYGPVGLAEAMRVMFSQGINELCESLAEDERKAVERQRSTPE